MPKKQSRDEFIRKNGLEISPDSLWIATFSYDMDLEPWIKAARQLGKAIEFIILGDEIPLDPPSKKGDGVSIIKQISQRDFDTLLSLCDLNIVRGEDSFATSLQLGKPTLWQAYRKEDDLHHIKVDAFLDLAEEIMGSNTPPLDLWGRMMRAINGMGEEPTPNLVLAFLESLGTIRTGFLLIGQHLQSLGSFSDNLFTTIEQLTKEQKL
jgi:hypothetical protein